ncbi:MAG TPA: hypothetical protein VIH17_07840 [Candidatus Acidoferrales bacterium]
MKALQLSLWAIIISLMATGPTFAAEPQANSRQAIGQVTPTGDVTLNEMPLPGVTTLFPGSRIRTGARSAAAVNVAGRGQFILGENSEATFPSTRGGYFTQLLSGSAAVKVEAGQALEALAGRFLITVRPAAPSSIEFSFQPDGSILALCQAGGALVIDLDGAETAALSPGSSIRLFPGGRIAAAGPEVPGVAPPAPEKREREPTGKAKKLTLLLLLAGGGGAGAALALARREESPSRP